MCALTFESVLIYHIIASRLVYTGLYCYFITSSSADFLYIIIYIGHIADCLNPIDISWYRHLLLSRSRLELLHRLVSRSAVLIYYLHICQLQEQTDWHARISPRFGPAQELSRSPRPVCSILRQQHEKELLGRNAQFCGLVAYVLLPDFTDSVTPSPQPPEAKPPNPPPPTLARRRRDWRAAEAALRACGSVAVETPNGRSIAGLQE